MYYLLNSKILYAFCLCLAGHHTMFHHFHSVQICAYLYIFKKKLQLIKRELLASSSA